jgi:hypothetical protein
LTFLIDKNFDFKARRIFCRIFGLFCRIFAAFFIDDAALLVQSMGNPEFR